MRYFIITLSGNRRSTAHPAQPSGVPTLQGSLQHLVSPLFPTTPKKTPFGSKEACFYSTPTDQIIVAGSSSRLCYRPIKTDHADPWIGIRHLDSFTLVPRSLHWGSESGNNRALRSYDWRGFGCTQFDIFFPPFRPLRREKKIEEAE